MFSALIERLFAVVGRRASIIIVIAFFLSAVSTYYAARHLTFISSFAGLSNEGASFNQNYHAFINEFNVKSNIDVVAEGPDQTKNEEFLDRLGNALTGNPYLQNFYYKFDLTPFKAWALAYPDIHALKKIDTSIRLAEPLFNQIGDQVDLTRFWETVPKLSRQSSQFKGDVTDLSDVGTLIDVMTGKLEGKNELPKFESPLKEFNRIEEPQYITLAQGKIAILFAEPIKNSQGQEQTEAAVKSLRETIAALSPSFPTVSAHLTGEPVLGVDEMETAKHDILWAGIISLVLCSAILIIGFGEVKKMLLTVLTLFGGVGWSMGYLAVSVRHLNVFTLSLFPMLIGLAVDFSIQFLGRYQEERSLGRSATEAAHQTLLTTGTGLLSAALITSLGFFAIAFTDYKGIAELGLATGGSLLLCFISTVTVLPALLIRFDHAPRPSKLPFKLNVEKKLLANAGVILTAALIVTMILGDKAKHIRFDHNILHLQAKGTDSVQTELDLIKAAGKSSLFAVSVADSLSQAKTRINQFRTLNTVGSIESPLPFIPADQVKKRPYLEQIKRDIDNFNVYPAKTPVDIPKLKSSFLEILGLIDSGEKKIRLASQTLNLFQALVYPGSQYLSKKSLSNSLADLFFSLEALRKNIKQFLDALNRQNPVSASQSLTSFQQDICMELSKIVYVLKHGIPNHIITFADLPQSLRDQFIGKNGKILIEIFPAQNVWERPPLERFVNELRQVDPDVTGSPILIYETTKMMLDSYKQAAKIAFWVIVLVTFFQFRSVKMAFFTLLPLGIGLLWLLGIMVFFHVDFNPANLLTLPVILGIGVAFGVYVVNRYRQEKHPSIFSTSTGRSVLLSALTSIAGFASLLGVRHRGLQSLGFTMTVGLSVITVMALLVLPALLEFLGRFPARGENP